ncbi:hypothetical protein Bca4012_004801 [Brassica carinata]
MNPYVPKTKSLLSVSRNVSLVDQTHDPVSPGCNWPLVVTGHTVYLVTSNFLLQVVIPIVNTFSTQR